MENNQNYLYEVKDCFLTQNEINYIAAMIKCLPQGYYIQPQVGLRTIINRTDNAQYQNELNRYVDACIFDINYHPIAVIEINDSSHFQKERIERDEKVKKICEEAGLPVITFWTKHGINTEYITDMFKHTIEHSKNPVRIKHSAPKEEQIINIQSSYQPSAPIQYNEQKTEDEYSRKDKQIAVALSVFFGFLGIPYYYVGRPLLGLLASIPFVLYVLIEMNAKIIPPLYIDFLSVFACTLAFCVNIISIIFFCKGFVKDKYGKIVK